MVRLVTRLQGVTQAVCSCAKVTARLHRWGKRSHNTLVFYYIYRLPRVLPILPGVALHGAVCRSPQDAPAAENKAWDSPHSQNHAFTSDNDFLGQKRDDSPTCFSSKLSFTATSPLSARKSSGSRCAGTHKWKYSHFHRRWKNTRS